MFDDIDDALDIVLIQKDEDAKKKGVVTHGGDVMFRFDKLK